MKTAAKRTEMANRRLMVAKLYLGGMIMANIAAQLGVNLATVSRDLTALRKEWLAQSVQLIDQIKAKELAKLDQLEIEHWEAWEKSKHDAQTVTIEQMDGTLKRTIGASSQSEIIVIPGRVKTTTKTDGQTGNPAFLAGVLACINKRCEILGLNAPKTADTSNLINQVVFINVGVDIEQI